MEQQQAKNLICYLLRECDPICWWYFNIAKCLFTNLCTTHT